MTQSLSSSIRFLTLFALIAVLSACNGGSSAVSQAEYFQYKYKIAEKQSSGDYRVPGCNGTHADISLADIIQDIRTDDQDIRDCAESYVVEVDNRRAEELVSVAVHGNTSTSLSDIQVRAAQIFAAGTVDFPTSTFLEGLGPLTPSGFRPSFSEVTFGAAASDIFSTRTGPIPFFEYELFTADLNAKRTSGNFQFVAQNMNDASDDRLLIVVDGTYLMDID